MKSKTLTLYKKDIGERNFQVIKNILTSFRDENKENPTWNEGFSSYIIDNELIFIELVNCPTVIAKKISKIIPNYRKYIVEFERI